MTWIRNHLFFWRDTLIVGVTVTLADARHRKTRTLYYEVDKHSHRRH